MTRRTCDSSVRNSRAICGASMSVAEASRMWARWRLDWYLARREIDFNRLPSSGASSRTKTSGGRMADRGHEKLPTGGHLIPHPSGLGSTVRCSCTDCREDAHEERKDAGGVDRAV